MTALQPFDTHPADPGTLSSYGESLASQASLAVSSLDPGTQHAYAPVVASWGGLGQAEAHHSAQLVSGQAVRLSGRVASATVALACWGRCVSEFNSEVASIVETVNLAGTGAAVRDLSVEDIVAIRSAARRDGEVRWHTAFDKHIVTGRDTVRRVLQEGPGEDLILELFQAGYLPMSIVNLFPGLDFTGVDWAVLSANLRARGIDPSMWAAAGSYDPAALGARLDLLRELGVPPMDYRDLLQLYWVAVAADKAGIDLSKWDPSLGASALSPVIHNVYTYYGDLYLENPHLQWAGMANMIGPSFAAGFFDLSLFRRIAQTLEGKPGVPVDMSVLASISDSELRFFETTFLRMQRDIFYDQAMMHEAYLGGGMEAIAELRQAGLIDFGTERAWQFIDDGQRTGDNSLIEQGNERLLLREQRDIIDESYVSMYERPLTGPAFTYLMTAVGEPSIPGAQSFADYRPLYVTIESPGPERVPLFGWDNPLQVEVNVRTPLPDGNIALYDDRWTYISEDTLPAYQELLRDDPERAQEIISSDVGDRIDDLRLHHRIDDLLWHYATDWGVDVDQ